MKIWIYSSESNSWIYFYIFTGLNKVLLISSRRTEHSFTDLGPEDRTKFTDLWPVDLCSSRGLPNDTTSKQRKSRMHSFNCNSRAYFITTNAMPQQDFILELLESQADALPNKLMEISTNAARRGWLWTYYLVPII